MQLSCEQTILFSFQISIRHAGKTRRQNARKYTRTFIIALMHSARFLACSMYVSKTHQGGRISKEPDIPRKDWPCPSRVVVFCNDSCSDGIGALSALLYSWSPLLSAPWDCRRAFLIKWEGKKRGEKKKQISAHLSVLGSGLEVRLKHEMIHYKGVDNLLVDNLQDGW